MPLKQIKMSNYKETYRGWRIESYSHPTCKFRYFELKSKSKTTMLGEDISEIKKQIDAFLN